MPELETLEIIAPNGDVKFITLDAAKGILNIGRHPDNDIVIESEHVAQFHAVLDHRQKPYQLMVLSPFGDLLLAGERLQPNVPKPINTWDVLQLDGFSVILTTSEAAAETEETKGEAAGGRLAGALSALMGKKEQPARQGEAPIGPATVTGGMPVVVPGATAVTRLAAPPPDRTNEQIVIELSDREFTVNVEQPAVLSLTVINGGKLVAEFDVSVQGIDPSWVTITPEPTINLNEGARDTLSIIITPPRLPTSSAGRHYFTVTVTSPTYSGNFSQKSATLHINPYYEFAVSELTPRQQSVSYRQGSGYTALSVVNRGNSDAVYRLEGEDTEKGCEFEFTVPGQSVCMARQAELRIPANRSVDVPIIISPVRRSIVGLRKRHFSFTITTTPIEGQLTPRSVLGQMDVSPLIGKWTILLMTLAVLGLIILIFRPSISRFGGALAGSQDEPSKIVRITAGESAQLKWEASSFAELQLKAANQNDPIQISSFEGKGTVIVKPEYNTTYELTAENLLSRINPQWWGNVKEPVTVLVAPVWPKVDRFGALPPGGTGIVRAEATGPQGKPIEILQGDLITLTWAIADAEGLQLVANDGKPDRTETIIQKTEFIGSRPVAPNGDTVYKLVATNKYTTKPTEYTYSPELNVRVRPRPTPTPTPVPTPGVLFFIVQPEVITEGQSVKLDWEVSAPGVKLIDIISSEGGEVINQGNTKGSINDYPARSQVFTLRVCNFDCESVTNNPNYQTVARGVTVNPLPTPTPTPVPPVIQEFRPSLIEVVRGSPEANSVKLIWLVSGDTGYINIEISSPELPNKISNLQATGEIPIAVTKSTIFQLLLTNRTTNQLIASRTTSLTVLEPTPTPTPPPPPPSIQSFLAESASGNTQEVVFTGSTADTMKYDVVAGSNVRFSWRVVGATKTIFDTRGERSPEASETILNVTQSYKYFLRAENAGGQTTRYVDIRVLPKPPPPPPFNVSGINGTTALTVTWNYTATDPLIRGFRVYRADVPSTNYQLVPNANELNLTLGARQFVDTTAGPRFCNKSYYVVAVYFDPVDGRTKESARGTPIWYSRIC